MSAKACETCVHFVAPGKRADNDMRYQIGVCQHPKARNDFGVITPSIARGWRGPCEEGRLWQPR